MLVRCWVDLYLSSSDFVTANTVISWSDSLITKVLFVAFLKCLVIDSEAKFVLVENLAIWTCDASQTVAQTMWKIKSFLAIWVMILVKLMRRMYVFGAMIWKFWNPFLGTPNHDVDWYSPVLCPTFLGVFIIWNYSILY